MHPRLRCIELQQFPPSAVNSGSKFWPDDPPSPINPEAAGAALVLAAPLAAFDSLPSSLFLGSLRSPGSATLPSLPHSICSSDICAFPAAWEGSPALLPVGAALPPGARLLGIPGLLQETQRHRVPEPTCTCFSCCFRKPSWLLPPTSPAFIYSLSCSRWGFFLSFSFPGAAELLNS